MIPFIFKNKETNKCDMLVFVDIDSVLSGGRDILDIFEGKYFPVLNEYHIDAFNQLDIKNKKIVALSSWCDADISTYRRWFKSNDIKYELYDIINSKIDKLAVLKKYIEISNCSKYIIIDNDSLMISSFSKDMTYRIHYGLNDNDVEQINIKISKVLASSS